MFRNKISVAIFFINHTPQSAPNSENDPEPKGEKTSAHAIQLFIHTEITNSCLRNFSISNVTKLGFTKMSSI